jgi:two-component system sensor histidine kinase/response regulator
MAKVPQMLMVTAYGREDVMRAARAQGIETVLIKPVNASVLFDTLMQPQEHSTAAGRRTVSPAPAAEELPLEIRGAQVLLVEDNELNQMVAMELLLDAGFAVDVAENGQIAIDRIERKHYDAVLMDMQMPVMDGESATRALRSNPRHAQLPIIAMTANAMEADRQRCFAAGMNDHVAKPIEPAALWAALSRWIRPRAGLGTASKAVASPSLSGEGGRMQPLARSPDAPLPAAPLPILDGLDTNLGLQRALGKPGLYAELLRRFAEGQAPVLAELQQALAANNLGVAERLAHTLRSVAANIGASVVSERAQALEHALRFHHGNESIVHVLAELRAALAPLLGGLQAWLVESVAVLESAGSVPDPGGKVAAEAVQRLRYLLEQDDPAATEFFQHNGKILGAALGDIFKSVEMHTLNFDFEHALEAMAALQGPEFPAAPLS